MPRRSYGRDYDKYSSLELECYGRRGGRRYENYDDEFERGTSGRSDVSSMDETTSGENSFEESRSKTAFS